MLVLISLIFMAFISFSDMFGTGITISVSLVFVVLVIIMGVLFIYTIKKQLIKIINNLENIVSSAINEESMVTGYTDNILSSFENKIHRYVKINKASKESIEKERNKIKTLVADISHQTKTPIANISLYSELLKEDQSKEYIEEIIFQTNKLKFLVESLLKASRLETGIIKLNPTINEINPVIEAITRSVERKARERSIRVFYEENKKYYAFFDPKWTEEAIYNIVDNSIKYSKDNDEVRINILEYPLFLRIDIIDNGIGISEDDMAKVFQRFYRSEAVSSIEGVGIGLYLSREIIQGQNGYIKVKSQVGRGSTFSIFLPRDKK